MMKKSMTYADDGNEDEVQKYLKKKSRKQVVRNMSNSEIKI